MGNTKSSKEKQNKDGSFSDNSDVGTFRKYSNNNVEKLLKNSSIVSEKLYPNTIRTKVKKINRSRILKHLDGELQDNRRMNVCNFLITNIMTKINNENHKNLYLEKGLSYLEINKNLSSQSYVSEVVKQLKDIQYYNILNYSLISDLTYFDFNGKNVKVIEGKSFNQFNIDAKSFKTSICANLESKFKSYLKNLSNSNTGIEINYINLLEKYLSDGDLSISHSIDNINFIGDSSLNQSRISNYKEILASNSNNDQIDKSPIVYTKKKDVSKNINTSFNDKNSKKNDNKISSKEKKQSVRKNRTKDENIGKSKSKSKEKLKNEPLIKIYIDLRPFLKKNDEIN